MRWVMASPDTLWHGDKLTDVWARVRWPGPIGVAVYLDGARVASVYLGLAGWWVGGECYAEAADAMAAIEREATA